MISQAKLNVMEHPCEDYGPFDEHLLNAYDEACAKYIDNKVDKGRFYKMYMHEIRQLVDNEPYKKIFNEKSCKFDAILNVYEEWNHKNR